MGKAGKKEWVGGNGGRIDEGGKETKENKEWAKGEGKERK